jgi:hypothetical protein
MQDGWHNPPVLLVSRHGLREPQTPGNKHLALVAKSDKATGFEPEDLGVRVSPRAPLFMEEGCWFPTWVHIPRHGCWIQSPASIFSPVAQSGERRLVRSEVVRSKRHIS